MAVACFELRAPKSAYPGFVKSKQYTFSMANEQRRSYTNRYRSNECM